MARGFIGLGIASGLAGGLVKAIEDRRERRKQDFQEYLQNQLLEVRKQESREREQDRLLDTVLKSLTLTQTTGIEPEAASKLMEEASGGRVKASTLLPILKSVKPKAEPTVSERTQEILDALQKRELPETTIQTRGEGPAEIVTDRPLGPVTAKELPSVASLFGRSASTEAADRRAAESRAHQEELQRREHGFKTATAETKQKNAIALLKERFGFMLEFAEQTGAVDVNQARARAQGLVADLSEIDLESRAEKNKLINELLRSSQSLKGTQKEFLKERLTQLREIDGEVKISRHLRDTMFGVGMWNMMSKDQQKALVKNPGILGGMIDLLDPSGKLRPPPTPAAPAPVAPAAPVPGTLPGARPAPPPGGIPRGVPRGAVESPIKLASSVSRRQGDFDRQAMALIAGAPDAELMAVIQSADRLRPTISQQGGDPDEILADVMSEAVFRGLIPATA